MSTAMEQFISTLKAARLVSTPLVVIRGPDSAGAIQIFQSAVLADPEECSLVHWDCMRGVQPINNKGKELAAKHAKILYPAQALDAAQSFPEETILFISNAHRFFGDTNTLQGVYNLRDQFKTRFPHAGVVDAARNRDSIRDCRPCAHCG